MTKQEVNTKLVEFKAEVLGKYVEKVDSNALNQCVDEAIAWNMKLGFPINIFAGITRAEQIYKTWTHPQFERIANSASFVPQAGDNCIWDGALNGGIGHISTATGEGDTTYFMSIDQNWVVGSPCTLVRHNYSNFLGVQRLKVTGATPPMNDKRPYWFDLLSKTEFGTTGWEKLTDAQINKWVTDLIDRKVAGGKWDVICDMINMPHTASALEVYNKINALGGCSPAQLSKAKEEGRKQGRQEIKDIVKGLA